MYVKRPGSESTIKIEGVNSKRNFLEVVVAGKFRVPGGDDLVGRTKLVIPGRLPGMNEMIGASNAHRHKYTEMKRTYTEQIHWLCKEQKLPSIDKPARVTFKWYCRNRRRDKDNISAGQKFILDGLQSAGVIKNDNWNCIAGLDHRFYIDKENERIEVELIEVE